MSLTRLPSPGGSSRSASRRPDKVRSQWRNLAQWQVIHFKSLVAFYRIQNDVKNIFSDTMQKQPVSHTRIITLCHSLSHKNSTLRILGHSFQESLNRDGEEFSGPSTLEPAPCLCVRCWYMPCFKAKLGIYLIERFNFHFFFISTNKLVNMASFLEMSSTTWKH